MNEVEATDYNYTDENGVFHLMAACGHTVSGSVKAGDKITLCPNCRFLARFKMVIIVYPQLMAEEKPQSK